MDKYLLNKKVWLTQIKEYAYEGFFEKSKKLIDSKRYKLTKQDATSILNSCGIDLRYWFIKPLLKIGGTINNRSIKFIKGILIDKKSSEFKIFDEIPDLIHAYKYIVKNTK